MSSMDPKGTLKLFFINSLKKCFQLIYALFMLGSDLLTHPAQALSGLAYLQLG